jgi:hypothetical protein
MCLGGWWSGSHCVNWCALRAQVSRARASQCGNCRVKRAAESHRAHRRNAGRQCVKQARALNGRKLDSQLMQPLL